MSVTIVLLQGYLSSVGPREKTNNFGEEYSENQDVVRTYFWRDATFGDLCPVAGHREESGLAYLPAIRSVYKLETAYCIVNCHARAAHA